MASSLSNSDSIASWTSALWAFRVSASQARSGAGRSSVEPASPDSEKMKS